MLEINKLIQDSLSIVNEKISILTDKIDNESCYQMEGSIVSAMGTLIIAKLPLVKIGDLCLIKDKNSDFQLYAEVLAIDNDLVKLIPFGNIENISQNCSITRISDVYKIKVGDFLLGKVVNGFGTVLGNIGEGLDHEINMDQFNEYQLVPLSALAPDPLSRPLISEPLITGVKSIDLFNTCGLGQRVGIFAGPGVGKTTLMGMILRNAKVDVIVVGLIGERGREVREFIELELDKSLLSKTVLVISTSDKPPVEQLKSAYVAQSIAEYFRDQGKKVLLFVDSITRFARAGREVGLSVGEPITRGGYPPSVFLSFPRLMERAGSNNKGSISAFYTILMEGDNLEADPISDEVKSIIDGHIVLSRKIAETGHFPAINVLTSLSRIADRIINNKQLIAARHLRLLLSKYEELEFLIRVGEYKKGQDKLADEALDKHSKILELLKQGKLDKPDFAQELDRMIKLGLMKG
ncbi:MAG: FliI/YscN family ATPase [Neisseriaceae bacterium]